MSKSTVELENEMSRIETEAQFEDFLRNNSAIKRETVGDRILELCDKYGIKSSELQKNTPISKSQYCAIVNGTRNPSREAVFKIALTLGVTIEEMNELLKLSKHKELYAKNMDDNIIKFGIKNSKSIYEIDELLKAHQSKLNLLDEG